MIKYNKTQLDSPLQVRIMKGDWRVSVPAERMLARMAALSFYRARVPDLRPMCRSVRTTWMGTCPLCAEPEFQVHLTTGDWECHGCKQWGDHRLLELYAFNKGRDKVACDKAADQELEEKLLHRIRQFAGASVLTDLINCMMDDDDTGATEAPWLDENPEELSDWKIHYSMRA